VRARLQVAALLLPALAVAGNAEIGREKATAERCIECHLTVPHDPERSTTSSARFPKLSGQPPAYLAKQLQDFRSGARRHEIMTMMAGGIAAADVADLAAYFGSLPTLHGPGTVSGPGARLREQARTLVYQGDAARGLPACVSCHGPGGLGSAPGVPPVPLLGGQERPYLEFQLRDWRSGERSNSPAGTMNRIAGALSEPEIEDLASYLASLPRQPALGDADLYFTLENR
jgi:cytochrome c553